MAFMSKNLKEEEGTNMVLFSINMRPILFVVGVLLLVLTFALIIPAAVDFISGDLNDAQHFIGSCFICAFIGGLFILAYRHEEGISLKIREAFLLTALSWFFVSVFAAFPFFLAQITPRPTDAIFEAVSALTTTGFTVIKGLDDAPKGLLLWRSLLQWLGGLGIVLMALTLLPKLKVGGMQLFYSEFSDRSEKIMPRISQIAFALLTVYTVLTFLCFLLLWLGGMTGFNALCHSMTTLATGGMSTSDDGLGTLGTPFNKIVLSVFMVIGASTLILFVRVATGDWKAYFQDSQIRAYLSTLGIAITIVVLWRWSVQGHPFEEAFLNGLFLTVSMLTTTGLEMTENWGGFIVIFFFILMFIGGCTGSTAGGIKIFRFQILYRVIKAQVNQLLHPHGVFIPVYNKKRVENQVVSAIFAFFALYLFSWALLALGLTIFGLDAWNSFLISASTLTNTGTYLGETYLNPAAFPTGAKCLLIFGMLLGRLEFITLIVVIMLPFWRH